jgi:hypothetical protein
MEAWLPAVTAGLTLANTIVLFFLNRRARRTAKKMNGMYLQTIQEAENRGRRLAQHESTPRLGE